MPRKMVFIDALVRAYPDLGREQILAFILCGEAWYREERLRDPKRLVDPQLPLALRPRAAEPAATGGPVPDVVVPGLPYVSRGGWKLAAALDAWNVPVRDHIWIDAGSSTGGFTHALLLRGASRVHAVDPGYNVLDWRLRRCPLVEIHERCRIQDLGPLEPPAWGAVADLSFRSLEGIVADLAGTCQSRMVLALIKPQFELKHSPTVKINPDAFSGVLEEAQAHRVLEDLVGRLASEGVGLQRIAPAAIRGGRGNQEYMAWLELENKTKAQLLDQGLRALRTLKDFPRP